MDLTITPHTDSKDFNIQELTWDVVRNDIKKVNPTLYEIIESLSPNNKLTLIKARYPYGASIINVGKLHLPHKSGQSISIDDASVNQMLKKKLIYSPIPLGLLLNRANEVFIEVDDRIIPLRFLSAGKFFGLFEVTDFLSGISTQPIWCVSSGSRSIFMLPKIADKTGYNRFKKELNIPVNPPRSLVEHWKIFSQISNHDAYINNWFSDIIFFTGAWFSKPHSDPRWSVFYNYIFRESNFQTRHSRHDASFNLALQSCIYAIGSRNLRPRPYIVDTLKHLIAIAAGASPAFRPTDNSEIAAPTKLIQKVYVELYGMKTYLPTLMYAHHLMVEEKMHPVYYSLAYPSFQEGIPFFKQNTDIISDEREIKLLFDTIYTAHKNGKTDLSKTLNLLEKVQYDFFHSGVDMYKEIKETKNMPLGDPALIADKKFFPDKIFCSTAPFLSGCIRLSSKDE